MNQNTSTVKNCKLLNLTLSLVQTVIIIIFVAITIASFGTRIPLLARFGLNFFAVTSGSMEPTIPTGSLVWVGKYKLENLKKGDVITFRVNDEQLKQSAVVTHRIDEVKKSEKQEEVTGKDGKKESKSVVTYAFKTKGDANAVQDSFDLEPSQIIGLYKSHIPKIGYLSLFAQTPQGFILMIVVPAAILIIWEVVSLILHFKKKYESKSKAEIAKLKEQLAQKEHINVS
jgi:signal peptidase